MFKKKKSLSTPADGRILFTRRALMLSGAKVMLTTILVGRLGYLGLIKSSHYRNLADGNRIKLIIILPQRGDILDRHGHVLANNIIDHRLTMVPNEIQDNERILALLARLTNQDPTVFQLILKQQPKFKPYVTRFPLTWPQVCALEIHRPELEGIDIDMGYKRNYTLPFEFSHLLGYVQTPSDKDQVPEELSAMTDYRVGKTGLEKKFEKHLKGQIGYREIEVNAHGHMVRDLSKINSKSGQSLFLSLDMTLQKAVFKKLSSIESGAAVVINIKTGEVLSSVSVPSFDIGLFVNGISHKDWQDLNTNLYMPLNNKAIQGTYPPGSIFKLVDALAALEYNKISPAHHITCRGYIEVGTHRFHCVHRTGHGSIDMIQALQMSCDVYFYELSRMIGIDRLAAMALDLGLGQETGIELPGEKSGLIPTRAWKKERLNQPWTVGDTIISSIGQGSMLATPLQMALLIARLVSGRRLQPTLLRLENPSVRTSEPYSFNPLHLDILRKGMEGTVNHPCGTAYAARIENPAKAFAGKTATSQVRRISKQERNTRVLHNDELEWRQRDHSIFAGYGPICDPKYAVCVLVEHGGGGGRVAGPLARDILIDAQRYES